MWFLNCFRYVFHLLAYYLYVYDLIYACGFVVFPKYIAYEEE